MEEERQVYDPVKQYGGALLRVMAYQAGKVFKPFSDGDIKVMSGVLPKPTKKKQVKEDAGYLNRFIDAE